MFVLTVACASSTILSVFSELVDRLPVFSAPFPHRWFLQDITPVQLIKALQDTSSEGAKQKADLQARLSKLMNQPKPALGRESVTAMWRTMRKDIAARLLFERNPKIMPISTIGTWVTDALIAPNLPQGYFRPGHRRQLINVEVPTLPPWMLRKGLASVWAHSPIFSGEGCVLIYCTSYIHFIIDHYHNCQRFASKLEEVLVANRSLLARDQEAGWRSFMAALGLTEQSVPKPGTVAKRPVGRPKKSDSELRPLEGRMTVALRLLRQNPLATPKELRQRLSGLSPTGSVGIGASERLLRAAFAEYRGQRILAILSEGVQDIIPNHCFP